MRQGLRWQERTSVARRVAQNAAYSNGPEVPALHLEPEVHDDLLRRMRRIEGQARGVQRMLDEGRDCDEVVQQLTAMRAALGKVAMTVIAENLEECLLAKGHGESRDRAVRRAKEAFLKLT